jgi:hypothetical protein
VYDVDFAGGGGALSIGGDSPTSGGFEMRIFGGRSFGGLSFADISAFGTLTAHFGGFHVDGGLGLELLTILRATNGDLMGSVGPAGLARLGYDFGRGAGAFVNVDASAFYCGALMWGPTIAAGYRF